ncbi:MAG TPA: class I SAM-dependent methyltransferase [Ignavibacteriaceae bacterium]|nr:class I SAM-dependent methyltransferase [Ignavibacteriaceae bacterium]
MTDQTTFQPDKINAAFTKQSVVYDKYEEGNLVLKWMREQVRNQALKFLKPGDRILELNSGTGADAEFFAQKGFSVYCTDLSDGMIEQMKKKFSGKNFSDKVTIQQCSFTELDKIGNKKFDMIFSNFGGLNCISDLRLATKFFTSLLNENGKVFLVLLPPVCPWELIQVLRGKFSFAFRRIKSGGAQANIEGIQFRTFYFSANEIRDSLGRNFKVLKTSSLGIFTPSPQMVRFQNQFPFITKLMTKIDEIISGVFPFNRIGDHIIVIAELNLNQPGV